MKNHPGQNWKWNYIFVLSLIIEGATERFLQFKMPLKPINNNKTILSMNKKVYLDTAKMFKQ